MKHRTEGHHETSISGDTRADWSAAFELVLSLQVAYCWHASRFTREVLNGLERIGFLYPQQIIWNKGRVVLTRTLYWFQHEPCWFVRKKRAPWYGKPGSENSTIWDSPSPKFIMGGSDEEKFDHPTQKPIELMRWPILNHTLPGESCYDPAKLHGPETCGPWSGPASGGSPGATFTSIHRSAMRSPSRRQARNASRSASRHCGIDSIRMACWRVSMPAARRCWCAGRWKAAPDRCSI